MDSSQRGQGGIKRQTMSGRAMDWVSNWADRREAAHARQTNDDGKRQGFTARRGQQRGGFAPQTPHDRHSLIESGMLRGEPGFGGFKHGRSDPGMHCVLRVRIGCRLHGSGCSLRADLESIDTQQAIHHRARRRRRQRHGKFRRAVRSEHATERAGVALFVLPAVTGTLRRTWSAYRHQSRFARDVGARVVSARTGLHQWHAHGCLRRGSRWRGHQHLGVVLVAGDLASGISTRQKQALQITSADLFGSRYPNIDRISSGHFRDFMGRHELPGVTENR
jgi:hypothetical protein